MPDLKQSEYPQITSLGGEYLIPVIHVSGNTKSNKNISVHDFLSDWPSNTHFDDQLSVANGALINGAELVANSGAILRGTSNVYHLEVANNHIGIANTFTPSSSDVSGTFPTGVHLFFDSNYIYVSINGTAKRAALSSFT